MPGRSTKAEQTAAVERRRFRIRPAYVVLALLMALFAFTFIRKTQEIQRLRAEESALLQQNQQTAQDNTHLKRSIRYYHTPQYIESQARGVLGYHMPGEHSILSQARVQPIPVVRAAPPRPLPPSDPVWKQWWHAFFG